MDDADDEHMAEDETSDKKKCDPVRPQDLLLFCKIWPFAILPLLPLILRMNFQMSSKILGLTRLTKRSPRSRKTKSRRKTESRIVSEVESDQIY